MAAEAGTETETENGETPEWGTRQSNRKAAGSTSVSGHVYDSVCENGCRLNWQHFIKKYKKH